MTFIWIIAACAVLFSRMIGGCVKTALCFIVIGFVLYRYPELQKDALAFLDWAVHKLQYFLQDL